MPTAFWRLVFIVVKSKYLDYFEHCLSAPTLDDFFFESWCSDVPLIFIFIFSCHFVPFYLYNAVLASVYYSGLSLRFLLVERRRRRRRQQQQRHHQWENWSHRFEVTLWLAFATFRIRTICVRAYAQEDMGHYILMFAIVSTTYIQISKFLAFSSKM